MTDLDRFTTESIQSILDTGDVNGYVKLCINPWSSLPKILKDAAGSNEEYRKSRFESLRILKAHGFVNATIVEKL